MISTRMRCELSFMRTESTAAIPYARKCNACDSYLTHPAAVSITQRYPLHVQRKTVISAETIL